MNRYVDNEMTFTDMMKRSFRLHYLTLKHTILCILSITLTKYIAIWLLAKFPNMYVQVFIYTISIAIVAYFFAAALLAAHRAFIDQPKSAWDALKSIWQRIIPILATILAYLAGGVLVYFFSKFLLFAVDKLVTDRTSAMHGGMLIISSALTIMFVAMFYFSFPIAVIDQKSVGKAFYDSAILSEKEKFGVMCLFFILGVIVLLLTPGTINEYFLSMYHMDVLFDFVVLCVGVPMYINLLLMLIHDAKQQVALEE